MKAAVARYLESFESTWRDETPVGSVRFLSVDTESTGLNPARDFLVAYGAVAVLGGEILLDDSFERVVRRPFNDANVTLHGITRELSQKGAQAERALADFLRYALDAVFIGHHIGSDIAMLNAAARHFFDLELKNRSVDTMGLALLLERDGVLETPEGEADFSLDGLCARFGIPPHDRHTAAGDAFLAAQVFLKLLPFARRAGRMTLGALSEVWVPKES